MKKLASIFGILVLIIIIIVTIFNWQENDCLALANFVMLGFTLIVLVWYAYDTNSIAQITRERWIREGVLSTTYSMELIGKKGDSGRTLFQIHNPSSLVVYASVACNFRLYGGDTIEVSPAFNGKDPWVLFPQQVTQGWFEINSFLRGKTIASMIAESTPENRAKQFTMLLELEFWDELGARRKLPTRLHYFDFDRWAWIPHITQNG